MTKSCRIDRKRFSLHLHCEKINITHHSSNHSFAAIRSVGWLVDWLVVLQSFIHLSCHFCSILNIFFFDSFILHPHLSTQSCVWFCVLHSFPLDHDNTCKTFMVQYMSCLRKNQDNNSRCRDEAKNYLSCRMDNELMAKEDWTNLGFNSSSNVNNNTSNSTTTTHQ